VDLGPTGATPYKHAALNFISQLKLIPAGTFDMMVAAEEGQFLRELRERHSDLNAGVRHWVGDGTGAGGAAGAGGGGPVVRFEQGRQAVLSLSLEGDAPGTKVEAVVTGGWARTGRLVSGVAEYTVVVSCTAAGPGLVIAVDSSDQLLVGGGRCVPYVLLEVSCGLWHCRKNSRFSRILSTWSVP
jgi:hypothetical protein